VLDRVELRVLDVPLEIQFVTDRVLPETSLPEHVFAVGMALKRHTSGNTRVRELRFDAPPTAGEIRLRRQSPNRMQVLA
jgi:hypothetical protein